MAYNMNMAITFMGIEFDIIFEYTPEIVEDDTFGCSAEVDIEKIIHHGVDFYDIMVPHLQDLEELILSKL